jgi:hypothetical protein
MSGVSTFTELNCGAVERIFRQPFSPRETDGGRSTNLGGLPGSPEIGERLYRLRGIAARHRHLFRCRPHHKPWFARFRATRRIAVRCRFPQSITKNAAIGITVPNVPFSGCRTMGLFGFHPANGALRCPKAGADDTRLSGSVHAAMVGGR